MPTPFPGMDPLHNVYDAGGYDLMVDYTQPPDPPLDEKSAAWAQVLLVSSGGSAA